MGDVEPRQQGEQVVGFMEVWKAAARDKRFEGRDQLDLLTLEIRNISESNPIRTAGRFSQTSAICSLQALSPARVLRSACRNGRWLMAPPDY